MQATGHPSRASDPPSCTTARGLLTGCYDSPSSHLRLNDETFVCNLQLRLSRKLTTDRWSPSFYVLTEKVNSILCPKNAYAHVD